MSETSADEAGKQAVEGASAQEAEDTLLTIHGKAFDVSTKEGRSQAKLWGEAFSTAHGRQANELGQLRQFQKERQPTATEADLIAKAKEKAAEGDMDSAIDTIFGYAKESVLKADKRLAQERQNDELWDEYLTTRPALREKVGKQKVKKLSEAAIDLYKDGQDTFAELDKFWFSLISPETPKTEAAPVTPKVTPKASEKPPITPSGGGNTPGVTGGVRQAKAMTPDLFAILDSRLPKPQ